MLSLKYNKRLKANESFEFIENNDLKKSDEELIKEFRRDIVETSGKMIVFNNLLTKILEDNHKVLVFSQFNSMLNILEDYLHYKGVNYLRFDGESTQVVRQDYIDQFNNHESKFPVFLLSTQTSGLALSLKSADTIVIFDSDFNPNNELHSLTKDSRIGSKKDLLVYRLV